MIICLAVFLSYLAIHPLIHPSIYPFIHPSIHPANPAILQQLIDTNNDGAITIEELAEWISRDEKIMESLKRMDTVLYTPHDPSQPARPSLSRPWVTHDMPTPAQHGDIEENTAGIWAFVWVEAMMRVRENGPRCVFFKGDSSMWIVLSFFL